MFDKQKIKWIDPLDLAHQISISSYNQDWIFLYSGLHKQIKNSKSYLGLYPQNEIISDDFNELEKALKNNKDHYFGYLGYELKNHLENLKDGKKSFIDLPNLWMIKFGLVLEFDHDKKEILEYCNDYTLCSIHPRCHPRECGDPGEVDTNSILSSAETFLDPRIREDDTEKNSNPYYKIQNLTSNFTKKEYLQKVKSIQKDIGNGKIYQANLTRKFFGKFAEKPKNPFDIFLKLNETSPANYSSFLKLKDNYIISSSPELFLKIDENGHAISSPIKGTSKRFKDKILDEKSKNDLKNNPKERAENLMIVDLVRNDFSKNCLPSSVQTQNLFKVSSYKTVHHLSSDIHGIKDPKWTNLDLVKSCFPAGSMTGAPKLKAMEICENLEGQNRGIYSGAIGLISSEKCELSVVIRTLIINKNKFEFQVGGAITFDSSATSEWQETMNKALGIAKTLGIKLTNLKKI